MSRVTSLRARSSFSLDSARTDFLTMSCAWSEFVPTTSMEPQTLSISRDLCWTPAIEKDFWIDRKSTRLNSSHANISYAVFCLKKKKNTKMKKLSTDVIDIH